MCNSEFAERLALQKATKEMIHLSSDAVSSPADLGGGVLHCFISRKLVKKKVKLKVLCCG